MGNASAAKQTYDARHYVCVWSLLRQPKGTSWVSLLIVKFDLFYISMMSYQVLISLLDIVSYVHINCKHLSQTLRKKVFRYL